MTIRQKRVATVGVAVALLGLAGCGGINASGSASPAMLLLQRTPARPDAVSRPVPVQLASSGVVGTEAR